MPHTIPRRDRIGFRNSGRAGPRVTSRANDGSHRLTWLRRGIGRDRIFAEPKLYEPLGTAEPIRVQSRQRFGLARHQVEKQLAVSR